MHSQIASIAGQNFFRQEYFTHGSIGIRETKLIFCLRNQILPLFLFRNAPAEQGTDKILCGGYSKSGKYFAFCDDYKQLTLWTCNDNQWTRLSIRCVLKLPIFSFCQTVVQKSLLFIIINYAARKFRVW